MISCRSVRLAPLAVILLATAVGLQGCVAASVAGATVGLAGATVKTAAKVTVVTVKTTGKVAGAAVHLTTNAAKYGAFSNRNGRVSVQWRWLQNGSHDRLLIEWQETGGPPVLAPSRSGYGTSIIRELIPFELGGEVELSFAPDGAKCRLEISGEWASKEKRKAEESRVSDSA